jgi:glycosyltransferase involved in cell wall biosynthesis
MKFAIITHVPHGHSNATYFAYAPYVREMNLWTPYVDEVIIVAPLEKAKRSPIDLDYEHPKIQFLPIPSMDLLSVKAILKSVMRLPRVSFAIYKAMKKADHIHLRCPGNIGLVGCFVQILFPGKPKTAKYAGNWDPEAKQPWSYKLQRWLLANTFLTKNMQALVYGEWRGSSKNIKPFFTATYHEADKAPVISRNLNGTVSFVFAGTFLPSKRAIYAVKLVELLHKKGLSVELALFGDGKEAANLRNYIEKNKLRQLIHLKGNQTRETLQEAFQHSHFVILPSQSEGWPKVIAEGMFWGCVPIATPVSCVPYMVDYGNRGVLLQMDLEVDANAILQLLAESENYQAKVSQSAIWSRKYTLDLFAKEIKALLNS